MEPLAQGPDEGFGACNPLFQPTTPPSPPRLPLPHHVFILPEIESTRLQPLTVLVLADGNRRSSSVGGSYAGGSRKVVSIAEHLALRPDVATLVACILSPDNIAKRGDGFFFALYKEFIQLGVDIETRGALVAVNVRLEIHGDLGSLRARGGHAVALADAMIAVAKATAVVVEPDLRLILGVGYGPDTAWELDVDVMLRTGMEEPGVLRLSGLRAGDGIATAAITTLWPDVEPREVDEVIELCKRRVSPRLARGHSISTILDSSMPLEGGPRRSRAGGDLRLGAACGGSDGAGALVCGTAPRVREDRRGARRPRGLHAGALRTGRGYVARAPGPRHLSASTIGK